MRAIAAFASDRVSKEPPKDTASPEAPRAPETVLEENQSLRTQLANLTLKLKVLNELNKDRELSGDLRKISRPMAVVGNDSGPRDSLLLGSSVPGILRDDQPVPAVYQNNLIGRVVRAGPGAAQVRLVTDNGFRVTGLFARFGKGADGNTEFQTFEMMRPLIEGVGGSMRIRGVKLADAKEMNLVPGDWVVLDDRDWPPDVQGLKVGQISEPVTPQEKAPLFAEIKIAPGMNLVKLREVMVVVK